MNWRKSSHSGASNCVEAGDGPGVIGIRDSALPGSLVIEFSAGAWASFTARLKAA